MSQVEDILKHEFVCPRCESKGAQVERLAMTGTGLSRFLDLQTHRYAFASCTNCGYTEVYNLSVLEGKDNQGLLLDILLSH